MNTESIINWLNIVSLVLGIIITALPFVIALIKNEKAKKAAELALKIAEQVQPYIVEAEGFINYSGKEKLAYVVTKANQFAIENNIKFDAEAVTEQIENLVTLTKQVNKRDKDVVKITETTNTVE